MTKTEVLHSYHYNTKDDRSHKVNVYSLMFDIVSNLEFRFRFIQSCISAVYREHLYSMFDYCDKDYITDDAFDMIEQIIENNILDDSEFYLIYDKKQDKWMFTLEYEWADYPNSIQQDCEYVKSNVNDLVYDYLDIWKGLNVFVKFCEAIIFGDYSWLKQNELPNMIPIKEIKK